MDILSAICVSLRVNGGACFRGDLAGRWGLDIAAPCEGMFHFHFIEVGECWLRMAALDAPVALAPGDLVVVPHGHRHTLVDTPDGEVVAERQIVGNAARYDHGPVVHGGAKHAEFLYGYFHFDRCHPHPVLVALPPLLHLHTASLDGATPLQSLLKLIAQETGAPRPGAEAVVNRMVEALFIQILRYHLECCRAPCGVLAAVADKQVSKALSLLHTRPSHPWTLDSLADQAGCSRSVIAARFVRLVGRTPMAYLHSLRMERARELLLGGRVSTAAVAEQVGYESESSFSKAFKKATGVGPGAFRRRPDDARHAPPRPPADFVSGRLRAAARDIDRDGSTAKPDV